MVLERLISVKLAVEKPIVVFYLGVVISCVSILISYFVFHHSIGMFSVFMITVGAAPFIYNLSKFAEAKEEELVKNLRGNFLARHRSIIFVFIWFFTGVAFTFLIAYLFVPNHLVEVIFQDQTSTITQIRGSAVSPSTLQKILINNLGVLALSFVFSLIYGTGAVFILAWNASVLGTVIGMTTRSFGDIRALPIAVLTYFPHGSLEMLAYFLGGIAGCVASAALTRREIKYVPYVLMDSMKMILASVLLLVLAAVIETGLLI